MLSRKTNIRVDELLQTLYDAFDWVVRSIAKQVGRRLKKAAPRRAENIKNCQAAIDQTNLYVLSKDDEGNYEVEKKSDGIVYFVRDNLGCLCFQDENCHCVCGACSYRFTCTCLYQLSGISCKHIHLAIRYDSSIEEEQFRDETEPFANLDPYDNTTTFDLPDSFNPPLS
ncbi:hypothetical protein GCK72_015727 [Caenorhabditis remanei]|uniref:SWIM-type domain-containing protein n=1 Tax=Caenorhabditis remanei TaxID=31234 RepID=A0A6A5GXZ4_CAERE|nr:hypothetical protein GCK72_015727 [Caenorhabditis remanei]KAF1759263.1 hypothetical protein GCK72_015727 [Caenorhabditis remanei]